MLYKESVQTTKNNMTKKINSSNVSILAVGALLAFLFVSSGAVAPQAHAAVSLDATTTIMLSGVLVATGNLTNAVQSQINAGAFTPAQSTVISAILGNIGRILVNISSMIGGITLPSTGELPDSAGAVN